ncbi:MAG: DUF3332 domain-containing protein [Prevotellaceae bacterium]|nr:DUF3332 domain-containing protein [Prevotellaceae bacterium]MDY3856824.1 DUF3332 domain-containing protein [Bacteroidaceae bacterium]
MRSKKLLTAACILSGCLVMNSCVGSFGLFNKLATWNKKATNSKFLNEIIFLLISPAYAVCGAVDALVLNSIEFWSGSNPIASVGKTRNVVGQDGKIYAVKTLKDGYEITTPDGRVLNFEYDKQTDAWSMAEGGVKKEIFRFDKDGKTIQAMLPSGQPLQVSLNEAGVYQTRLAVNGGVYFAAR